MRKKYIKLSAEKIKEVADLKGVTIQSVYSALRFDTNSNVAMLIRAWAMQHGGQLFVTSDEL